MITDKGQTELALHEAEEHFRDLADKVPVMIWMSGMDGLSTYNNQRWLEFTGRSFQEQLGKGWADGVHHEDRQQCMEVYKHAFDRREPFQIEYRLRRHDGEYRWVLGSGVPRFNADGSFAGYMGSAIDVTELKRAMTTLQESEDRFRLVANTAPVLIWMSGVDKLCIYFNQPWLDFTGRSLEAELGNGWAEGIHPEDLERCLDTYTKAFDRHESFQIEYRLRRHDGKYRSILDSGVPRFNADGSFAGYIGSCIDITEQKLAKEALSTVNQKLIQAHEEERAEIARELHDDINQRLALLAISLEKVQHNPRSSKAEITKDIAEAVKQVQDLGSDVQALSHHLHSSKLEYLGLAAAAAGFCREVSNRQEVEIDFHSENIPKDLPKEASLCLFRVLQEAIQNATKHSGSRHFEVSLSGGSSEVELTVRDFGIGFDPEEAMKGRGLGLTSISERLKLVNGNLSIDSQPQHGTTLLARVPLISRMKSAEAAG
jgi:PAS domain S-box-containing protein